MCPEILHGVCYFNDPLFATLTFAQPVMDLEIANRFFKQFIQRLNNAFFKGDKIGLQYVAVPEFQKDVDFAGNLKESGGSVHYHILIFNLRFIPKIYYRFLELWRVCEFAGSVHIVSMRDKLGISIYLIKNFAKSFFDVRFFNKKRFFVSRNLKRSVIIYFAFLMFAIAFFGVVISWAFSVFD